MSHRVLPRETAHAIRQYVASAGAETGLMAFYQAGLAQKGLAQEGLAQEGLA